MNVRQNHSCSHERDVRQHVSVRVDEGRGTVGYSAISVSGNVRREKPHAHFAGP
jgi:hypothetical protein